MAQAVLGALRVNLAANVARFKDGLDKAGRRLQRFNKKLKRGMEVASRWGQRLGVAAGAALGGFIIKLKQSIEHLDKLAKASRRIGVPVKQLSAMEFAAEQSGVKLDELVRGFRNLARNAKAGMRTPNRFTRNMEALDVQFKTTEGTIRRADKILLDLADRFQQLPDGANKTAASMAAMGEEVGPRLIPMLNLGSEGIRKLTEQARKFGLVVSTETAQKAEKFNDTLNIVRRQVTGIFRQVAARLLPTLQTLANMLSDVGNRDKIINSLVSGFKTFVRIVATLVNTFKRLQVEIAATAKAIGQAFSGDFSAAMETFNEGQKKSIQLQNQLNQSLNKLGVRGEEDGREPGTGRLAKEYFGESGKPDVLIENLNRFQTALNELNAEGDKGKDKADEFGSRWQKNINNIANKMGQLGGNISAILGNIFGESKAVAIAQTIINTSQAVMRTLAQYGATPWGLALAGTAAAAGATEIANIRSTSKSGSGGGSRSSSSVGQSSAGQGQATGGAVGQTLTVQGIDSDQLFTGDAVRNLAERLLDYQKDGGKIILPQGA